VLEMQRNYSVLGWTTDKTFCMMLPQQSLLVKTYLSACKSDNTPWAIKNVPVYFCLYLRQLLTDFQNFFTVTYCGQLAIKLLLNISPHFNCVATLLCETYIILKITKITMIRVEKKSYSETIFTNFCKLCLVLCTCLMFVNKSR